MPGAPGVVLRRYAPPDAAATHEVRGLRRIEVRASRVLQPLLERLGLVLDEDHPDHRREGQVLANATLHLDLRAGPSPWSHGSARVR